MLPAPKDSERAYSSVRLERTPDKREVVGSIPTRPTTTFGGVAQLGEHLLCKQGVIGSIPFTSTTSSDKQAAAGALLVRSVDRLSFFKNS